MMQSSQMTTEMLTGFINRALDAVQESKLGPLWYWVEYESTPQNGQPLPPIKELHFEKDPIAGCVAATKAMVPLNTMKMGDQTFQIVLQKLIPTIWSQEMTMKDGHRGEP